MKALTVNSILIVVVLLSCAKKIPNPLEGAWVLVKGEQKAEEPLPPYPMTRFSKHMKLFTATHFATVWQDTTRPNPIYPGFNAGTYTFVDGLYTEHLDYFSIPTAMGTTATFKVRIEGNRLFLSPATADGKDLESGFFEEWKKLE